MTISHLKLTQIIGRFWFRVYRPKPNLSERPQTYSKKGVYVTPAKRQISLVGKTNWILLNDHGNLNEIGWTNESKSKLWRYNQHYFDDLNAVFSDTRLIWHRELIEIWIVENPPGEGVGWDPYPTSLRIVNWVKWYMRYPDATGPFLQSLAIQARWLEKRLEWHLLGNHLFSNAKALIHVGVIFEGKEADRWLNKGFDILHAQYQEQILKDGAHFELSPMYHAIALEDMLDLYNILVAYEERLSSLQRTLVRKIASIIPQMIYWLNAMSHPDNQIAFFNDCCFGIAPQNKEIKRYANALNFIWRVPDSPIVDLEASGYVRLNSKNAVLLFDCCRVGPDYLPGHAHADTLSLEFSLFGNRVFVNSGTSEYAVNSLREFQRGTSAHNTLTWNNQNSSDVWSSFRVGSRANITARNIFCNDDRMMVIATHDGYSSMFTPMLHTRCIELGDSSLVVEDMISGSGKKFVNYYLHPKIQIKFIDRFNGVLVAGDNTEYRFSFSGVKSVKLISTSWYPEFNIGIPNTCLSAEVSNLNCKIELRWG